MLSGGLEPETCRSVMVQLVFSGVDILIQPASHSSKINSFALWMEVWNIYLSIIIDHMPARIAKFVVYQSIITSYNILAESRCPILSQTLSYVGMYNTLTYDCNS